ncbi:putative E3 ubiquitin-protein ligase TRIML1 [Sarcophilus harrisii]
MLQPHLLQKEVGLSTCDQHGEQEMFFCEKDQRPLCDSCLSATEHKDHQVLPLETAADKCKKKLHQIWRILQKKEEKFQTALDTLRRRQAQFREQTYTVKQSAISEYGKIHQFLWDEEYQRLESLGQQSRDNVAKLEEKEHELTQQIQNVRHMVFQVEEKLDNMPLEMIHAVPDTLKKKEELLLKKTVISYITWPTCPVTGMREMLRSFHRDITFDPESAHPHLILSEDLKRIQYGIICQDLPDNKEKFKSSLVVLGAQKFTSGKHYWEVEVGDMTEWELGICKDSIRRKGIISSSPEDVSTLIGFTSGKGCQCSSPLQKVGIFVDYEMKYVAFYDVIDRSLIHSLSDVAFEEPLCPYFCVFLYNDECTLGSLTICPKSP